MEGLNNLPPVEEEEIPLNSTGLKEGLQGKSFDYQQKIKLLDTITDKGLHDQAVEELDEYRTAFEALNDENKELTTLQLDDLKQEYERDISALTILESSEFSSQLPVDAITSYFSESGDEGKEEEEQFYSILNSIDITHMKAYISDFNTEYVGIEDKDEIGRISDDNLEDFIGEFVINFNNKIESEERIELENLDVNSLKSQESIDYYKEQINSIKENVSNDVSKILDGKITELEIKQAKINAIKDDISIKKEDQIETTKLPEFHKIYTDLFKTLSPKIKEDYSKITDILSTLTTLEENDVENIKIEKNKLISVLSEADKNGITVAEQFLQDLGEENPEMYSTMLQSFKDFSPVLAETLKDYPVVYTSIKDNITYITDRETDKLRGYEESGNIATKRVDSEKADLNKMKNYNEQPPQSYIVLNNGFKLNSTVDFPQKEIDENQKIFEDKNDELTEIISDNISKHQELVSQKGELLSQQTDIKKQLLETTLSPEDRGILEAQAIKIQEELVVVNNELNTIETVIQNTEMKLEKVADAFKIWHQEKIDKYNLAVENKEKKSIEVGEFLQGIGFNLIPTSITQNLLSQLNSSGFTGVRNQIGFNRPIDLDNGVLGYENSFDKDTNISLTEKVIFAEFMNRMISGDKGQPIDINIVLGNTGNPIGDVEKFNVKLAESGLKDSGTGIVRALDNINKSFIPKTTEETETPKK